MIINFLDRSIDRTGWRWFSGQPRHEEQHSSLQHWEGKENPQSIWLGKLAILMSSKFNTERGEQLRETSDVNLRPQHVYTYTHTQVFTHI